MTVDREPPLPQVPKAVMGRTGITTSRFGLGTAVWPLQQPYDLVVEVFRTAFAAGIRHVDTAPLYGSEEVVGRALKDAGHPEGMVFFRTGRIGFPRRVAKTAAQREMVR